MSQPARAPRPVVDDTDIAVRNRRMLMVGGVMVILAFIVAAGYWYTHQSGKAPAPSTELSITRVDGNLVVGSPKAKHKVVIEEQFNCTRCARFARAAQTFLHADAAAGLVQIRYVVKPGNKAYDDALATDPAKALKIHDDTFAAGGTGVGAPMVYLNGKWFVRADELALADALELALAK